MEEEFLRELRARRTQIVETWEALLRAEPVTTPLGHPDALVHLINWTLDQIFSALTDPLASGTSENDAAAPAEQPSPCPCGRNPLLAYFAAGEQALHEGLVLTQAALTPLDPVARDTAFRELNHILGQTARREISAFCGVCQYRVHAELGASRGGSLPFPERTGEA